MKKGKLLREGKQLLPSVWQTEGALERARGLLFRSVEAANSGLIIKPCNSVHSFFMTYAIDVVYLDLNFKVLKVCCDLKPWRISYCSGARQVLELAEGMAKDLNIKIGDTLTWYED